MGRAVLAAWLGLALCGCAANVQMVQRDGCWVRRTESFPKNVKEEIGVCGRPPPIWSNDRVERLVQECMAEADFRWQNEALAAWNSNQPLPPQRSEHEVMQQCMNDAATAVVTENEALKKRIAEIASERDALRTQANEERQELLKNQAQMTDALGEAAKRPAPNAFATSNSNGTASTTSDQQSRSDQASTSAARPESVVPVPVIEPLPSDSLAGPKRRVKAKVPPQCTLPGSSLQDGACVAPVTQPPSR